MLFCKPNKPKSHPWLTVSLVALAAVGVAGICGSSKAMMCRAWKKVKGMFSSASCPCPSQGNADGSFSG